MNQPFDPSAVALLILIVLRFVIPLALTIALAWLLRRLDAHWQSQSRELPPATMVDPSNSAARAADSHLGVVDRPCWEYRACPESKRKACPAGCSADVLCWLARLRHDGRLPSGCRTCPIFTTTSPLRPAPSGAD